MNAPTVSGPTTKRHRSSGIYRTPREFLDAIEARFGPIRKDLAASAENRVCDEYFDEHRNALSHDWRALHGTAWCNPPFDPIVPWLKKALTVRNRAGWTLVLAPASVGAEWFAEHVDGKAVVLPLRPRVAFVGQDNPYPRDLAIFAFGFGLSGFGTWRWKP